MTSKLPFSSEQFTTQKLRQETRRFVDSLGRRLGELEKFAGRASEFEIVWPADYVAFKQLFLKFSDLCDEFQILSAVTEMALSRIERPSQEDKLEAAELEHLFRELQMPMLRAMIGTNLRLLRMWDYRVRSGEGLPYGSRDLFHETVRIVETARGNLLRPRYMAMLDEDAMAEAEEIERLLKSLISKTRSLPEFAPSDALNTELMNLINGSAH